MILEVKIFKRESASHGSRVPFALLPFEHRSIKLLKLKKLKKTNDQHGGVCIYLQDHINYESINNRERKFVGQCTTRILYNISRIVSHLLGGVK